MFSITAMSILFLAGVFCFIVGKHHKTEGSIAAGVIFLVISAVWFLFAVCGTYAYQQDDFASVKQTERKIDLFAERRENLIAVIRAELAKYPEYEKKIIGDIKPSILLQFPNLKSNETIVETAKQVVKLEDDVYALRSKLIEVQGQIYAREISPWVAYVKPYAQFFGKPNPVSGVSQ